MHVECMHGRPADSNLSGYDAGCVAVAESHACTLVTADARIKRSGAARCDIRVIN